MKDAVDPPVPAPLARWCASENDVIRSAALRALPAAGLGDDARRSVYLAALLDPDADIRSDAMEALVPLARPEDAATILRSLEGDPVREVKIAAIAALGRLGGTPAVALLRALVLSRAEDRVAWEDDASDWEDWLDVQVAAIDALGLLGETDAIEDFFAARDDELGQNLDIAVFDALGRLGLDGVAWLLAVMRTEGGLAGQRAASALQRAAPDSLRDHMDALLRAPHAGTRRLAATLLPPDSDALRRLACEDADPQVRAAAMAGAAPQNPDLARAGLADGDAQVQVAALEALPPSDDAEFRKTLADNLLAWLNAGPPALAQAAARHLPRCGSERALPALLDAAKDEARPLEIRIAAAQALAEADPGPSTDALCGLLASPSSQVRTVGLLHVHRRALSGDADAGTTLARAIEGTLLDGEADSARRPAPAPDMAMPKGEGAGRQKIRITPEGEIVPADETNGAPPETSTLSAIIGGAEDHPGPEGSPAAPAQSKRRAIEGPDGASAALVREALQIGGALPDERVLAVTLSRAAGPDSDLRRIAWTALAGAACTRSAPQTERLSVAAQAALGADDPLVRHAAFRVCIGAGAVSEATLAAALTDEDALVRCEAVGLLTPERALDHLADPSPSVRRAVVARLARGPRALVSDALTRLLERERVGTLADMVSDTAMAQEEALSRLGETGLAAKPALILLEALARASTAP
ncbi:MAG: HEAT repeat domain-containing protein [Pseudomonadota bacterium]